MGLLQELNYITGCICASLGLVVSIIFIAVNNEGSHARKLLAAILFSLSLFCFSYAVVGTQFYLEFPHLWRLQATFSGLVPALLYLYVRSVLNQEFRLKPYDYLLAIPGLLIFVHFFPFYMLSGDEKRVIILQLLTDKKLALMEIDGLFPLGFGMIIRSSSGIVFTFLSFLKIHQHKRNSHLKENTTYSQNLEIYKWLYFLLIIISFSYILLILWNFLAISDVIEFFVAISFTTAGLILFISTYLFCNPKILYGFQGWINENGLLPDAVETEPKMSKSPFSYSDESSFSPEMRKEIRSAIENHFKYNKPFIASGYKIKDLSLELDIPVYLISSFINHEYGMNFNEFINDYRVDYITEILKESAETQSFTLEAVAQSAGFNSRTTFIAAVKKKSGMTPSSYFSKKTIAL